ncbi:hypothetical protein CANINC_003062 [Pichia inconspicua]|uniref:Gag1-like clamp domain-containing protein n=1 Tax=Pichia inconspicua TaxID=52247 RepID=A0A4T0WZQ5_9ASCO|nr:hypothetical protein CANINC_003062 [[Candida] inconspicua]
MTTTKLKHKKSFSNKLRETCSNVVHSLKQISNAVLLSSESNRSIDDLFDSSNDSDHPYYTNQNTYAIDFESALRREKLNLDSFQHQKLQTQLDTTVESTPMDSFISMNKTDSSFSTNSNLDIDGFKRWDKQRQDWLKKTQTDEQIALRKSKNSLNRLTSQYDDVYINIYRNLVQQGRPLKKGINMIDGFKIINAGWEQNKMYERIADGGVP